MECINKVVSQFFDWSIADNNEQANASAHHGIALVGLISNSFIMG